MNPVEIPEEDSEDLLDSEVERAVVTTSVTDIAQKMSQYIKDHRGQLSSHEFRRRKPHLYWRSRVHLPDGTEETLVYQIDWMG